MSTIIIDTVVTTTNVLTTGTQGPAGPRGPAGDPALIEQLQAHISALASTKLDAADYVQHFRGLFTSYINLSTQVPTAIDGDYAHIKENETFGVMEAIWDSADSKWVVSAVNVGSNTDAVAEGSTNLYFTSERVRQTTLNSINTSNASPISPTDTFIEAFGKSQAQADENKWNWVEFETVGTWGQWIKPYYEVGGTGGIQVCKKDGALWMRGMFEVIETSSNLSNQLLTFIDPLYFLDINRALIAYPSPNWIGKGASYIFSTAFRFRRNQNFFMYLASASSLTVGGIYLLPPTCIGPLG